MGPSSVLTPWQTLPGQHTLNSTSPGRLRSRDDLGPAFMFWTNLRKLGREAQGGAEEELREREIPSRRKENWAVTKALLACFLQSAGSSEWGAGGDGKASKKGTPKPASFPSGRGRRGFQTQKAAARPHCLLARGIYLFLGAKHTLVPPTQPSLPARSGALSTRSGARSLSRVGGDGPGLQSLTHSHLLAGSGLDGFGCPRPEGKVREAACHPRSPTRAREHGRLWLHTAQLRRGARAGRGPPGPTARRCWRGRRPGPSGGSASPAKSGACEAAGELDLSRPHPIPASSMV